MLRFTRLSALGHATVDATDQDSGVADATADAIAAASAVIPTGVWRVACPATAGLHRESLIRPQEDHQ